MFIRSAQPLLLLHCLTLRLLMRVLSSVPVWHAQEQTAMCMFSSRLFVCRCCHWMRFALIFSKLACLSLRSIQGSNACCTVCGRLGMGT